MTTLLASVVAVASLALTPAAVTTPETPKAASCCVEVAACCTPAADCCN